MFKTLVIAALLVTGSAFAVDTPGVTVPSLAERLDAAREAIKASEWRKALAELQVALREEPRNADVHNLLGYSYRKQARPNLPKAFEHYQQALRFNPRHLGAHEYISEAYLVDKKPEMAEKHLAELEKLCGNKTCEEYADLAKALADYRAGK